MASKDGFESVQSRGYVWDGSTWVAEQQASTAAGGAGSTIITISTVQGVVTLATTSTGVTVTPAAGSTFPTRPLQSSAADLQMTATPVAGSTWIVRIPADSTIAAVSSLGGLVTLASASTGVTVTPAAGSTFATRPLQSSAADLQVTATPVAGSTWNVRPIQSSAADLQVTATPAVGSTYSVRPLQSSAADLLMTATIGGNLQTTSAPSSNSSAVVIRWPDVNSTVFASTNAGATTSVTVVSSLAVSKAYVTAYTITSTVQAPVTFKFYSGTTLLWPIKLSAPSSAASGPQAGSVGANLAVSAPSWLFRGATGVPLTLQYSATGAHVVAVSYYVST